MLKATAAAAVGLGAPIVARPGDEGHAPATESPPPSAAPPTMAPPWWLGSDYPRSRVVEVRSERSISGGIADAGVVRRMLRAGLTRLTGHATAAESIAALLGDRRRTAIKFNSVGAGVIRTSETMGRALLEVLADAGVAADRLTLVEPPPELASLGLAAPARGWGAGIPVGDGIEPVAAWVHEADAIINVPFLKTHQFAGMSGALKNISHAVVQHPARYHANGCAPFVSQIYGSKIVSDRVRLTLLNALRIVVRNGPDALAEDVTPCGMILCGLDPVAVDSVGRLVLDRERSRTEPTGSTVVRYLDDAVERGLGRGGAPLLEHVVATLDGE